MPIIVSAQFLCTSLWFAGNAIIPELAKEFDLTHAALGHITSAIQFGFIVGTLCYAVSNFADRFSPSTVFFLSAIAASACNIAIVLPGQGFGGLLALRFFTGFFLAGIYPVGMKIAADYYDKGLGKALGFLVGALVIGTSFPHLLKSFTSSLPWKTVLFLTSGLSLTGGILIRLFVPDGPYRKKGQRLKLSGLVQPFYDKAFRSASFGYFGHMWELYTFWAFVPVILGAYQLVHPQQNINIPAYSFAVIGVGGLACVASGYISQKYGSWIAAFGALFLSGCCCLLSPLAFFLPFAGFILFLIFWGLVVIADSPMFSSLVAQSAPATSKGTALTIVTCIGFSITILSIELLNTLRNNIAEQFLYLFLLPGPVIGLFFMLKTKDKLITNGLYYRLKYSAAGKAYTRIFKGGESKQVTKELDYYSSFLPSCSMIFDIGANDGHKTIAFTSLAEKVIACEPDLHNLAVLKARFRKAGNIVIEPFAISDHKGVSNFFIHEPGSALNTINAQWKTILETENKGRWEDDIHFSDSVLQVNTITLDDLIAKHGIPEFIKIDVEGNERKVLSGLSHAINYISFEVLLPEFLGDATACMDKLMQLNGNTRFNYAVEEKLMLPNFLSYKEFKRLLSSLTSSHLEVIATTQVQVSGH